MEYRICESSSALKLQKEVNQLMQDGWQPLGGVAVGPASGKYPTIRADLWYYQAMIKDDPQSIQAQQGIQSVK